MPSRSHGYRTFGGATSRGTITQNADVSFASLRKLLGRLRGNSRLERELAEAHEQIRLLRRQVPRRTVSEENIVWVFGAGRTGSSWLARMMGDADGHAVWFEPQLGLLFDPDRTEVGKRKGKDFIFARQHRETWQRSISNFVLDGAAARFPEGPEVLVIKEPHGSAGAGMLTQALPASRVVLLVRDTRDVIASALDAVREGIWKDGHRQGMYGGEEAVAAKVDPDAFVEKASRELVRHVGEAKRAFDAHRGPKALVRYEDLRADTLGTMRRLYSKLGLSIDEEELASIAERHSWANVSEKEKGRGKFYRKATPGGWREDLTIEQAETVRRITASLLEEFYP